MVWPFCRSTTSKLANTAWNKWTPIDSSSNMQKRLQKKESSFMKRQLKHGYMIHVLNYTWFVMPTLIRSCFLGSPMRHTSCLPPGHTAPKPLWKHFIEWHLNVNYLREVSWTLKKIQNMFKMCLQFISICFVVNSMAWLCNWAWDQLGRKGATCDSQSRGVMGDSSYNDTWWDLEMRRGRFTDLTTEIIHLMIFICCHTMPHQCSPKTGRSQTNKNK